MIKIAIKHFGFKENPYPDFPLISIVGLCIISTITGYFSISIKIGLIANIIFFTIGVVIFSIEYKTIISLLSTYYKKIKGINRFVLLSFSIAFLTVLVESTYHPKLYDTGLYHTQVIKWISEYGVVAGLGNLHGRYAFNSAWFLPSALFSFSFLNIQSFHVLNGLLFLFGIIFTLDGLCKLLENKPSLSMLIRISIFAILFFKFRARISSPDTDMPSTLLVWISFMIVLDKIKDNEIDVFNIQSLLIIIFSSFAVIIKLSVLPIMILPLFIIYKEYSKHDKINVLICLGIISLIILPWIIRNIILSGYLIYPFPQLDIFNFDWKIPLQDVINMDRLITGWARIPHQNTQKVMEMPFSDWIPIWFQSLHTYYKYFLSYMVLVSFFYIIAITRKSKNYFNAIKKYSILYFTAYAGVLFWFIKAPDIRFGYAFLMILFSLLTVPLFLPIFVNASKSFINITLALLLSFQIALLYKSIDLSIIKYRIFFPTDYRAIKVKTVALKNLKVYSPIGDDKSWYNVEQCWNAPLPCTHYANPKLELREQKLGDGFKINR